MTNSKLLRRAQTISPFGVGAIIDQDGESFVPADITWWKDTGDIINEPRLEAHLQVKGFRQAPAIPGRLYEITPSTPGVPCVRFPKWMFCQKCRRMKKVDSEVEVPVCSCISRTALTPMRFVMVCPRGHLSDVPWEKWAHSEKKSYQKCENPDLYFLTHPGRSGLESLEILCKSCGNKRSLGGIASINSLQKLWIKCPGTQPWQNISEKTECDAVPQVNQRGATNITFHIIESSIDIPPYSTWEAYSSDTTKVTSHIYFNFIRSLYESGDMELLDMSLPTLARSVSMELDEVKKIVMLELTGGYELTSGMEDAEQSDYLIRGEYNALTTTTENFHPRDRFIKRTVNLDSYPAPDSDPDWVETVTKVKQSLAKVVQVTRLREVRALRGFSRLSPVGTDISSDDDPPGRFSLYNSEKKVSPLLVPADLNILPENSRWLPAIEVFGEGIFFTLDEDALKEWEAHPEIVKRAGKLVSRRDVQAAYLPSPTPRLLLLHTVSHLLIRQLSFDCGYSVASLRERLYVSDAQEGVPMAGVLIYTAAGDSEGTLGGLVRQGKPDRFLPSILTALQNATWCSSDPLCQESQGQGMHSLNLAACHACSLLPETSCTLSNRLLDRIMLTGSIDGSIPGFFTPVLKEILTKRK